MYTSRRLIAAFFNYRIQSATKRLQFQQEERVKAIQRLKDATKYQSTLELLEKYGGEPNRERQDGEGSSRPVSRQSLGHQDAPRMPARTNLPPPPTANIQVKESIDRPLTPNVIEPSAEFAPNAEAEPALMQPNRLHMPSSQPVDLETVGQGRQQKKIPVYPVRAEERTTVV